MEQAPQFEQPSTEELTAEIERHMEYIRSLQDELTIGAELAKSDSDRTKEKIAAEWAIVEGKQKLLETLN